MGGVFNHLKSVSEKLGQSYPFFYVFYEAPTSVIRTITRTEAFTVTGTLQTVSSLRQTIGRTGSAFLAELYFASNRSINLYDSRTDDTVFDTLLRYDNQLYRLLGKLDVQGAYFEYELDLVRNEDFNLS